MGRLAIRDVAYEVRAPSVNRVLHNPVLVEAAFADGEDRLISRRGPVLAGGAGSRLPCSLYLLRDGADGRENRAYLQHVPLLEIAPCRQ